LPATLAITIAEDVNASVLIAGRADRDFVKIAVAFGIVVIGRLIESGDLDKDRPRRSRATSSFPASTFFCHVDGNIITAIDTKQNPP
jgi:hypothetical protein